MGKAGDKKDADLIKAEKREADARARLSALGGTKSPAMLAIARFFSFYATKPRPDLFIDALERIDDLGLMLLPEHRNSIAGAVAAVLSLHPECQDSWRMGKPHPNTGGSRDVEKCLRLARIVTSAERLAPPMMDESISRPGHVDYLWMAWVVTRDSGALRRVLNLAHRVDPVGEAALVLLHTYAHLPEIQSVLIQTLQKRQQKILPHQQTIIPPDVPVDDVHDLTALLAQDPVRAKRVVLVGWVPGDGGGFVVVTVDGTKPHECPETWRQRPVRVRKASIPEMRGHKELLDAAEDP